MGLGIFVNMTPGQSQKANEEAICTDTVDFNLNKNF